VVSYNNVSVTLFGTIVPAPGAVALLGLAGLAGSRRRR
jgi:xanthosine utilization system XapX-like protein